MPEIFYGPWNVRLNNVDPDRRQRFNIIGSANTDGRYLVSPGQMVNLDVAGEEWSVTFEIEPFPPEAEEPFNPMFPPHVEGHPEWFPPEPVDQNWHERMIRRSMRFESPDGMIVQLDSIGLPRLSLTLVCKDPAVNPDQGDNPYDFTLPF